MGCQFDPDCGTEDVDGSTIFCTHHQGERERLRDPRRDGQWLPPGAVDAHGGRPDGSHGAGLYEVTCGCLGRISVVPQANLDNPDTLGCLSCGKPFKLLE